MKHSLDVNPSPKQSSSFSALSMKVNEIKAVDEWLLREPKKGQIVMVTRSSRSSASLSLAWSSPRTFSISSCNLRNGQAVRLVRCIPLLALLLVAHSAGYPAVDWPVGAEAAGSAVGVAQAGRGGRVHSAELQQQLVAAVPPEPVPPQFFVSSRPFLSSSDPLPASSLPLPPAEWWRDADSAMCLAPFALTTILSANRKKTTIFIAIAGHAQLASLISLEIS